MVTANASHLIHQILLVESDHRQAALIREELGARPHLRVHILPDVVNAIRFLAKRDGFQHAPTPDLILLDLQLPYFSGAALLEERRRRPAWSAVPVVVISGSADDRLECLAHGADDHVVAPSDPAAWHRLVETTLARHLPLATIP